MTDQLPPDAAQVRPDPTVDDPPSSRDTRYVVDEIIPMLDDGYGPDGYVVLDMIREETVASFMNTCPDAHQHAQYLCDELNTADVAVIPVAASKHDDPPEMSDV